MVENLSLSLSYSDVLPRISDMHFTLSAVVTRDSWLELKPFSETKHVYKTCIKLIIFVQITTNVFIFPRSFLTWPHLLYTLNCFSSRVTVSLQDQNVLHIRDVVFFHKINYIFVFFFLLCELLKRLLGLLLNQMRVTEARDADL